MTAVVTADPGKPMGEVATFQVFFYNLGNNWSPESIFPFITLVIDLYKLLKMISDASIEWCFLRQARTVYARLFCHNGWYKKEVFDEKSYDENIICYPLLGYQMPP